MSATCGVNAADEPGEMLDGARRLFLATLAEIGVEDLAAWAKANPSQFFATLLKLAPASQLGGDEVAYYVSETPVSEEEWAKGAHD